jgi:hypothetical protein
MLKRNIWIAFVILNIVTISDAQRARATKQNQRNAAQRAVTPATQQQNTNTNNAGKVYLNFEYLVIRF